MIWPFKKRSNARTLSGYPIASFYPAIQETTQNPYPNLLCDDDFVEIRQTPEPLSLFAASKILEDKRCQELGHRINLNHTGYFNDIHCRECGITFKRQPRKQHLYSSKMEEFGETS